MHFEFGHCSTTEASEKSAWAKKEGGGRGSARVWGITLECSRYFESPSALSDVKHSVTPSANVRGSTSVKHYTYGSCCSKPQTII